QKVMQMDAQPAQAGFAAFELGAFLRRDETAILQILPAFAEAGGLRDPQDGLQVTLTAGAVLDVRLQAEGGAEKTLVTRVLLLLFCNKKFSYINSLKKFVNKLHEQFFVA